MITRQIKTKFNVAVMIVIAVISLTINALAAVAPSVSSLEPLDKGLNTPLRMALDQNGDIYVADPRSGGVVVLDKYGVVLKTITVAKAVNALAILNPLSSNIQGGKLLVALSDQVVVLDQGGNEISKLGSGVGQFKRAAGVAIDANGKIYVADSASYSVKMFGSAGNYVGSFGVYGAPPANGVFMQPTAVSVVTVGAEQRVAVVDTVNGNVQFFTTDGVFDRSIGASGTALSPLSFSYPVGVAFDSNSGSVDRMYVLDTYQGNIQVVDLTTTPPSFLSYIGSYGFGAGQLSTPSDMVYDQVHRRLLVSNGMSNIVSFGIDGGANPYNSVPPTMTVAQPAVTVNVPYVTLDGTIEVGCTLSGSANTSAKVSAASFPSSSAWTVSVDGLVAGLNTISLTARNQYGATVTKTIAVTYLPPANQLSVSAYPALTSQVAITLTGTTEPGSQVTIYNAATDIVGQASVIDNVWMYVVSLVEGENSLSVSSAKTGTSAARQDFAITLDTKAPLLNVSMLDNASATANQVLSISGTVSDPHMSSVAVNGNAVQVVNGQFNTALALNYGPNAVTISAVDQLGNASTVNRSVTFDPAQQIVTVLSPVEGVVTNLQDMSVTVSAPDATGVKVNGVPAEPGAVSGQWNAVVKLALGINTLLVDATDSYSRSVQEKRTVYFDNVAPVVTVSTPAQDIATKLPGMMVKGLINDNTEVKSITATLDNVDVQLALENGEYTVFAEFLQEGVHNLAVTVTDVAGNKSTALRTIIYDVTPPLVTVDPVIAPIPTRLSGTVEAGSNVVVSDAAGVSVPVVTDGATWSADLSSSVVDFASLNVKAFDAAGNNSVKSISVPVPDGDVDGDGSVTIRDALRIIKIVVSGDQPTVNDLLHGDVGPLLNGKRNPDGKLDMVDAVLLLRKALGQASWL